MKPLFQLSLTHFLSPGLFRRLDPSFASVCCTAAAKRKRGNAIKKNDLPDQFEELEYEADEEEEDNENATVPKKKSPHSNGKGRRATSSKKKHLQDQYEEVDEETDEEEEDNEKAIVLKRKSISKGKRKRGNAIKKKNLHIQYEEPTEETEEEEDEREIEVVEEEENENTILLKKKSPRSKAQRRRIKEDLPDHYGADIFKSGRAVQPTNPYFVTRIRAERRYLLYIPVDVIRDYNLELPPRMIICDSTGRKFKTDIKRWKDGRIWLSGGWINLCRWNLVEKEDQCICEFVKGEEGLHLQVQVLHNGGVSNPARENN